MKYQVHTVDARIEHFMKKKLEKFPELRDIGKSQSESTGSVRFWDGIASIFVGTRTRA